tara:strand:+ start:807 stop:941 length:135 start_codon:yes stop_codon:yes gene_type:complete
MLAVAVAAQMALMLPTVLPELVAMVAVGVAGIRVVVLCSRLRER